MPENGTKITVRLDDEYMKKLNLLMNFYGDLGRITEKTKSAIIRRLIDVGFGVMQKELEPEPPPPGAD